jgi:hypothetical protein
VSIFQDCNFKNNPIGEVCGSDGVTYQNLCYAESEHVQVFGEVEAGRPDEFVKKIARNVTNPFCQN